MSSQLDKVESKYPPEKPGVLWGNRSTSFRLKPWAAWRRPAEQFHLIQSVISNLLLSNIVPDYFFLAAYCRWKIAACPKILSGKVPGATDKCSGDMNCALALDVTYDLSYRIFGGIEIYTWTWSEHKCPSNTWFSRCRANSRMTSPRCWRMRP